MLRYPYPIGLPILYFYGLPEAVFIVYRRWRNSIGEFLKDNAGVRGVLRTMSNICDGAFL